MAAALGSLREQGSRAVLSMVGIGVGATAIVLLVSIALGVQRDVTSQVRDLGVNVLVVIPGRLEDGSVLAPNIAGLSYLGEEDVERVRTVPGVLRATPITFVGGGIRAEGPALQATSGAPVAPGAGRVSPMTFIIAARPEWFAIRPVELAEGRVLGPEDDGERVVVIGSVARRNLFGEESALGRTVLINGEPYRVVGVTRDNESESSLFSQGGFENIATIPFATLKERVPGVQIHRIMIQTEPSVEPKSLIAAVDAALGERLDRQTYSVLTQEDILGLVYRLMGILTWLLTGLTSIALFVGGVGIMTVMLMSVNERAKEIGIRKTVGARRRDIFAQFLTEAVAIALLGGLAGLGLSAAACAALETWTPIRPLLTPGVAALGLGVSLGVGAVFGLIPALAAARRDPVVSLRRE